MKKQKEVVFQGMIALNETCDCTDPCYDKDVWCRHTVEEMFPGDYACYALVSNEGDWGERVAESWIIHEDFDNNGAHPREIKKLKRGDLREVGVDAGLFGYFNNKPDFTDGEWMSFCDSLGNSYPTMTTHLGVAEGFVTSSGYGDGGYDVQCWNDENGNVAAISTRFI